MPQLLLVRHAEPSIKGTLLGRSNPGLSDAGRIAAHSALNRLDSAIAYVSPLKRAMETAAFLPAAVPRVTLRELAEISLGDWEGLRWSEVEEQWPDLAHRKLERWFDIPAPGGETWDQISSRATEALQQISRGPFPAIVIAHHGINAVLAAAISGHSPYEFSQSYCEIIPYEFSFHVGP